MMVSNPLMDIRRRITTVAAASSLLGWLGCGPALVPAGEDAGTTTGGTTSTTTDTTSVTTDPTVTPPLPSSSGFDDETSVGIGSGSGSGSTSTGPFVGSGSGSESSAESSSGGRPGEIPGWFPEECAPLADESAYCLAPDGGQWSVFGVDSGFTCTFGDGAPTDPGVGTIALAWEGASIVRCVGEGSEGVVARTDIETGATETTDVPCDWVVDAEGDLLVLNRTGPGARYDDFDALLAGAELEPLSLNPFDTRVGAADGRLYTLWHSTDEVNRIEIETGNDLEPVPLEGHDDWVFGVDRTGDELLVATRDGLKKFDAETGAFISIFEELEWLSFSRGFSCRENSPAE